ncbi:TetR/AcrR family transcriptional regulator [Streptosporangium sp. NBC_01755]|uniref:TetR/AcrR family transcriptional regulator n=1 Tax=unclassified Streptosporangium TaxID=2632669 RepID=UPI002DD929C6|nr:MULTISPECIES: TetR/AcrR family transcriptional regulator [unclassified Streptosporangium]WSA28998.1 TetR/AcrR family transcriptional regulator [Streptosporangium sp. NBC_01810]WSC99555.1 TetR/AcrR family transcriptional regulator [Streptosporangium sp. NBC_01755]
MPSKARNRSVSKDGAGPKSSRTRERILDAAAHVLSRKGYSGTRLGDIADQAQLQAPAIYYYFGSREELIEEVMWTGAQRVRQHVTQVLDALPADTTPMDRICAAVEAHLHVELELSDFATALIRNSGQIPEDLRTRQLAEEAGYGKLWRDLFRALDNAGQLRPDLDLRVAHLLVVGALNWAAEWWNPKRDTFEAVVRTAQSLIRHGLSTTPPDQPTEETTPRPRRNPTQRTS